MFLEDEYTTAGWVRALPLKNLTISKWYKGPLAPVLSERSIMMSAILAQPELTYMRFELDAQDMSKGLEIEREVDERD